jgi:hypothetical protein
MPKTTKKTGTKRTSATNLPKPQKALTASEAKKVKGGAQDFFIYVPKPKPTS